MNSAPPGLSKDVSRDGIGDKGPSTPTYAQVTLCGELYVYSDFDRFTEINVSVCFLFVDASKRVRALRDIF